MKSRICRPRVYIPTILVAVVVALVVSIAVARERIGHRSKVAMLREHGAEARYFLEAVSYRKGWRRWLENQIGDFPYLLRCRDVPLDDAAVETIWQIDSLVALELVNCELSDRDLQSISRLERLGRLDVSGNPLTDEVFTHLHELPRLNCVVAQNTAMTSSGVREFQAVRPDVQVVLK